MKLDVHDLIVMQWESLRLINSWLIKFALSIVCVVVLIVIYLSILTSTCNFTLFFLI